MNHQFGGEKPNDREPRQSATVDDVGVRSSMDRASDFGSEGWGFKSLRARVVNSRRPALPPHVVKVHPTPNRFARRPVRPTAEPGSGIRTGVRDPNRGTTAPRSRPPAPHRPDRSPDRRTGVRDPNRGPGSEPGTGIRTGVRDPNRGTSAPPSRPPAPHPLGGARVGDMWGLGISRRRKREYRRSRSPSRERR